MFSICKQFLKINEDLFLLKKVYEESYVKDVDLVKEWLDANSVFRKDGKLYFCDKIEDLELVEEKEQELLTK